MIARFLSISLLVVSTNVAALSVIYDSGRTVDIRPYLDDIAPPNINQQDYLRKVKSLEASQKARASGTKYYPIKTPELSPGRVIARKVTLPTFTSPLCLIGDDKMSLTWLIKLAPKLAQFNTTCLLVNVRNEKRLNAIRKMAPAISIIPANATELAKKIHVTHYPVLISKGRIEQ